MKKSTIASDFERFDAERQDQLAQTRKAVWLCGLSRLLPWLNSKDRPRNYREEGPYQSIGRLGIAYATTALHLAMYPPLQRFFSEEMDIGARLVLEQKGPQGIAAIVAMEQRLRLREIGIQATIESAGNTSTSNMPALGFSGVNYRHLMQLTATGSSMRYVDGDNRTHLIRRSDYVTRRDTSGLVEQHIVKRCLNPLTLTDKQLEKAKLDRKKLQKETRDEREKDMHTRVEWHPRSRVWVIDQELNDYIINSAEYPFSPYMASEFELWPGDHEGRGLADQLFADLSTYDQLRERFLDWTYAASQLTPVIDYNSEMLEEDFEAGNGVPIRGRVVNGTLQDATYLKLDKLADFDVVLKMHEVLRGDLAKLMVIKNELAPQGEAGRSSEAWRQFATFVNEQTGGLYAQLVDGEHLPMIQFQRWKLERDGRLPAIPKGSASPRLLVGVAALARQAQAMGITDVLAVMAQFDPETRAKFDPTVLAQVLLRYRNIDAPGVIKTKEQLEAEAQAKLDLQARSALATEGAKALGQVATGVLANQ